MNEFIKQDEKTIIRSLFEPTIKIDLMAVDDAFTGTAVGLPPTRKDIIGGEQYQNFLGSDFPFVKINDYVFDSGEIVYFQLDQLDFLPRITFIFKLTKTEAFRSQAYPKDGDLMSVFIRARNNSFKPVRNDYVIKTVSSSKGGAENMGGMTTITGELFIPHLRDQIIKSHKGNSFDVLQQIAKELQLGFATNETSTVDTQTWLSGANTWEDYIKEISKATWKDINSFYKVFIDIYYHLNFINVNNQIEGNDVMAAGILDNTLIKDYHSDDIGSVEKSQTVTGKFLSNLDNLAGTNMYVRGYETLNQSSSIHQQFGYKYEIQFFDQKSLQYWNIFIDPKTNDEDKKIILKGRLFPKTAEKKSIDGKTPSKEIYWKSQNRAVWKGIQSKNVHDKYLYAISHNERNLMELRKLYLKVDVNRWNPNIYMGEKIPLILINRIDNTKAKLDAAVADPVKMSVEDGNPVTLDQFYSGFYMVDGMSIIYNSDVNTIVSDPTFENPKELPIFIQTFTMTRREWPTPV